MILSVHGEKVIVRSLYLHAPAFKAKSDETPDECTAIARPHPRKTSGAHDDAASIP